MYPSRFKVIRIGHSLKPLNSFSFQKNRTKDFETIMCPAKNIAKVELVVFENVKPLAVFKSANVACNLVCNTHWIHKDFLKLSNHMLMTLQVPCNDYSKHYIMTGKTPKTF